MDLVLPVWLGMVPEMAVVWLNAVTEPAIRVSYARILLPVPAVDPVQLV